MATDFELHNNYQQIKIAVIIAIILGLVTSVFFIVIEKESYTAIYLIPESIFHNSEDNSVFYAYGVTLFDSQKMEDYTLETYIDDKLIKTKEFSLNNGETLEEREKIILPAAIDYPEKITLLLKSSSKSESIHFWINNATL